MNVGKCIIQPLYFRERNEREQKEYDEQMKNISALYEDEAEFLPEKMLGECVPEQADAVVFPQMIGAVYRSGELIKCIMKPVILMTSQFGTVEMWDWEIAAYLRENLNMDNVFTPYNVDIGKTILRSIALKKILKNKWKFLIFQDSPGEGMQANIFKRFYWWEKECVNKIEDYFGTNIVYKSWKEINQKAETISDDVAERVWQEKKVPAEGVDRLSAVRAVKLYLAIRDEVEKEGNVLGVESNCLNESFLSGTTPCLAWNWLFEYDKILWACEGDLVTLLSEVLFYYSMKKPLMMTNIYPFLVGMAALKHEKIDSFPEIEDSDNHALGVHCGYFGFLPQSFSEKWILKPKVLEIVNDHAVMPDAEMSCGPVVLAKIHANMRKITVIEAELKRYVGYPGSDCRNGAIFHYKNKSGHKIMESLSSHHAIVIQGDVAHLIQQMGKVFDIEVELF